MRLRLPFAEGAIPLRTRRIALRPIARAAVCALLLVGCESTTPHTMPTLSGISPSSGARASTVRVTLTGAGFMDGESTIAVSGGGITVANIAFGSETELAADFVIGAETTVDAREVTVTTRGGTSGAQTFNVLHAPPTLSAISPSAGVQGSTVSVTLTGTHFANGATVAVSGSGVTVSGVTVASGTSITASFAIASDAATGAREVTVTTAGGTTTAQTFTVDPPAPTLTSVSPSSGVQGNTVSVMLTGTNFVNGATVAVSGSGVTVSGVTVGSETAITASFAIASDAATGAREVTVTTSGGTTDAKTFTINPPAPTLTSVSPASGVQGNNVSVTLTGTNFVSGATVAVSGSGVTVSGVTVASGTSITASFAIGSDAATGAREVTVTTSGGTTDAKTFTINPPAPTLTSLSPASGVQGNTVSVTLTGTNFVSGATVAVSGSGVAVSDVTVASGTSITASFAIGGDAALGDRDVTITTSGGTTSASTFTINPPAPTLTAVSPTAGVQGNTVSVTLTGTNFVSGATVAVSGSGVTVSGVTVASGTSITASFAIASDAILGDRNVTVSTSGGTTGAQTFTIDPPPPTLTDVSPEVGLQGETVSVTLTGTNFVSGSTTVSVSGANVTVNNVSVGSGTSLTAEFVIGDSADTGARDVTVTTAGGTSGAQTFTVNSVVHEVPISPSRLPGGDVR